MARGIYKRTMRRASSGSSRDPEATLPSEPRPATPPAAGSPSAAGAGSGGRSESAAPLIGKRTLFVDRQVSRRARARSKTKLIRRLKMALLFLILCLIGVSMGWILTSAKLDMAHAEKLALDADLRRTENALEETRIRLTQRESELFNLVENRIPGLESLVYNKLIDINDKYVLNITFAESGVEDQKGIEYHAMLKNQTAGVILPDVTIFLFDEFGLQAGLAKLDKKDATRTADLAELAPGETRSYHATIEIDRDKAPKYYMVYVQ